MVAITPERVAIFGPTASGKTALSLALAQKLGGEIISFDSRAVYRGMDIGTAKPTANERNRVPHHGLDVVDPGTAYSAGRFGREARDWITDIEERGKRTILAGGTGFFLRSLTVPLFPEPVLNVSNRDELRERLAQLDTDALLAELAVVDPQSVPQLSTERNRRRITRAIEIARLTGKPLGEWWSEPAEAEAVDISVVVLEVPQSELDARIAARVEAMINQGWVEEVQRLVENGLDEFSPGLDAHGYREIVKHLRGELTREETIDAIVRITRKYAKRQRTWARTQMSGRILPLAALETNDRLAAVMEWMQ